MTNYNGLSDSQKKEILSEVKKTSFYNKLVAQGVNDEDIIELAVKLFIFVHLSEESSDEL